MHFGTAGTTPSRDTLRPWTTATIHRENYSELSLTNISLTKTNSEVEHARNVYIEMLDGTLVAERPRTSLLLAVSTCVLYFHWRYLPVKPQRQILAPLLCRPPARPCTTGPGRNSSDRSNGWSILFNMFCHSKTNGLSACSHFSPSFFVQVFWVHRGTSHFWRNPKVRMAIRAVAAHVDMALTHITIATPAEDD